MEALFIVPAMVSPQVNEKLIPALSKMIERNILLNNASLFKKAAMIKYEREGSWTKIKESGEIPIILINDNIISEDDSNIINFGTFVLEAKDPYKSAEYFTNKQIDLNKRLSQLDRQAKTHTDPASQSRINRERSEIMNKMETIDKLASSEFKKKLEISKLPAKLSKSELKSQAVKDMLDNEKTIAGTDKDSADAAVKRAELRDRLSAIAAGEKARSAELDYKDTHKFSKADDIEHPTGIKFFSQISLEPTILEIPIYLGRKDIDEKGFVVKVGVKCIPYIIDDVQSTVNLLNQASNLNWFSRNFKLALRKVNTKIWFTKRRAVNRGDVIDPKEAAEAITYSPNTNELKNPMNLVDKFSNSDSGNWATMIILSSYDLEQDDSLVKIVNSYRKLTKYVIGDLIITNETKESAYFCTPRLNHCQEIPFTYLNKVLNLKDVLDYSEASRASAWNKESNSKSVSARAIKEDTNINKIEQKLNDILFG